MEQEGFVKNIQGRGCYVMGRDTELIREQLIRKIESNLSEAINTSRTANLSAQELHHLLDILLEDQTDG